MAGRKVRPGGTPRPTPGTGVLPGILRAALFLLLATFAHAADALKAELSPLTARPRSDGPMAFDIKLSWQGNRLLEGALELTLLDGGEPVLVQRTQELALLTGKQSFQLLVPPRAGRAYSMDLEARLRFLAKQDAIALGTFPISQRTNAGRNFVIGICTQTGTGNDRLHALWQSLRFERFQPQGGKNANQLTTSPVYLPPTDFPSDPLACMVFDVALFDGTAFGQLRSKQLAALGAWVNAGGSVCIVAGGKMDDEHLSFLNTLATTAANPTPFQRDALSWLSGPGISLVHAGLGRCVVAIKSPDAALDAPEWRRAAAFLWKYNARRIDYAVAHGNWVGESDPLRYRAELTHETGARARDIQQFTTTLLPQSARLIPPSVVVLILGTFVVLIGPGDWFVLGWLRRRRFTWIVFPVVAVAFTAITVVAAGDFLGSQDHRSEFVVTDLGRDGRVVRETRFVMHFAARSREAATELRHAIGVPAQFQFDNYSGRSETFAPPAYSGQFPARSTLHQQLRQWAPQINRITSIEAADDSSGIAWDTLDFKNLDGWGMPAALAKLLGSSPNVAFLAFHENLSKTYASDGLKMQDAIRTLCKPGRYGLDEIRIAPMPHASGSLDDLQIHDPEDPAQWTIVALQQTDGGLRLTRRVFRKD